MSEVARLREQIELECEAMRLALYGYATVASHEIINRRYDALDAQRIELEKHLGKAEAMRTVIEIYARVVG